VPELNKTMDSFEGKFNQSASVDGDERRKEYTNITSTFYNLITDFYEFGWGQSFHFAPRHKDESFDNSIARYEHFVASKLGVPEPIPKGYTVLDVGCGIGGPMRTIARFFQYKVTIVGCNITEEHIRRAKRYNAGKGIRNCEFLKADFNEMPVPDNTFDAVYDFEATLHSTDTLRTFKEIFRVVKPGGRVVTAQYCLLELYVPTNPTHVDIIRRVDNTNGCYVSGRQTHITTGLLKKAGFTILSQEDVFDPSVNDVKFSEVFEGNAGKRFSGTKVGLWLTWSVLYVLETLRIVPKGTAKVQDMLMGAATSFKEAGRERILTPGMLYVLEKPRK